MLEQQHNSPKISSLELPLLKHQTLDPGLSISSPTYSPFPNKKITSTYIQTTHGLASYSPNTHRQRKRPPINQNRIIEQVGTSSNWKPSMYQAFSKPKFSKIVQNYHTIDLWKSKYPKSSSKNYLKKKCLSVGKEASVIRKSKDKRDDEPKRYLRKSPNSKVALQQDQFPSSFQIEQARYSPKKKLPQMIHLKQKSTKQCSPKINTVRHAPTNQSISKVEEIIIPTSWQIRTIIHHQESSLEQVLTKEQKISNNFP